VVSIWSFFQTKEGRPHGGRLAGVLYIVGLAPGFTRFDDPLCLARIIFVVGWWLAFGGNETDRTIPAILTPQKSIGCVLLLTGLVGQSYIIRHRASKPPDKPEEAAVISAVEATDRFHAEVSGQRYQDACSVTDPKALSSMTGLPCSEFLAYAHETLGAPINARRAQLPTPVTCFSDDMVCVDLRYQNRYEHGTAREHFEWRIKEKQVTLISYALDTDAFSR
jgi:hypothetical protein